MTESQHFPFATIIDLAEAACDEKCRDDEGDYRARHALADYVSTHPEVIVNLVEHVEYVGP